MASFSLRHNMQLFEMLVYDETNFAIYHFNVGVSFNLSFVSQTYFVRGFHFHINNKLETPGFVKSHIP